MRGPAEIPLGKLRDALMTTASANTGGKRDVGHERREGWKGGGRTTGGGREGKRPDCRPLRPSNVRIWDTNG